MSPAFGGNIKMKISSPLTILGVHFFLLSFLAFGGANSAIPEMHRLMVYEYRWMSEEQFADLFAISRATPGPTVLISTLLGWYVAHFWGALVTTLAICLPSSVIAYCVGHLWKRFNYNPWLQIIKEGLFPIVLGFVAAAVLILIQISDHSWVAFLITGTTAVLSYKTQMHPLWLLGGAMILGVLGWV